MKYTPRSKKDTSFGPKPENAITMPPLPFNLPAAVTDETAPRVATIRRKMRKVSKPKPLTCSRPVFDHIEVQP